MCELILKNQQLIHVFICFRSITLQVYQGLKTSQDCHVLWEVGNMGWQHKVIKEEERGLSSS